MWIFWIQFITSIILILVYSLYTLVFIFWCVYLIDAVKRKRIYYQRTLRCLQREDLHQQTSAYNAKTQIVKYSFLFCINLIEWLGCTCSLIPNIILIVQEYHHNMLSNSTLSDSEFSFHLMIATRTNFHLNLPYFNNLFLILTFTLIGSLSMYLASRYAQKSWIKSNSVPYWICFFAFGSIVTQILVTICYTTVIGVWCESLIVTLTMIFTWRQYRKLLMVIKWSIVDLQVGGRERLVLKQIRMKRTFTRIFTFIWIAAFFILSSEYVESILETYQILFPTDNYPFFVSPFSCEILQRSTEDIFYYVDVSLLYLEISLIVMGALFLFIPYTCYGLITMCVMLWRMCKGRTGYRTHFHNQLCERLI